MSAYESKPEPTRLERLLFRLEAQHRSLNWAFGEIEGRPVVNMWCTHRPKLRKPVPTAARTMKE